ncbi:hypothetical protein [Ferruginibacter sp.]
MNLVKYYAWAAVYPSAIVMIATVIFTVIENSGYKSEWLTEDSINSVILMTTFVYCIIISLLCTTIFLCGSVYVKNNPLLSFLSWFLLPVGFICFIFFHEINAATEKEELIYIVILNIPFILGLMLSYYHFRKAHLRPER